METIDIFQKSIDFIEENLKADFSVIELAETAGFSLFHYYRLFGHFLGMPVKQYITRRRLLHAAAELRSGKRLIDTALEYGFDTSAGFYKAFRREFDCAPSLYTRRYPVAPPYPIRLRQEELKMITHEKVKEILHNWPQAETLMVSDIYYEGSGFKAENAWDVGDAYVLKAGKNLFAFQKHRQIVEALKTYGMDLGETLQTKDGKEFAFDGELYFRLCRRVPGKPLNSREFFGADSLEKAEAVGKSIGVLHQALVHCSCDFCDEGDLFRTVSEWAIPKVKASMDLPESFYREYLDRFGPLSKKLPRQLIHRDPHPGNILVCDNKPSGFVDFEISEKNVRIFDPCYFSTGILSETIGCTNKEGQWFDILKAVLTGYNAVCPLTPEEKQAIPDVLCSIQLICVAWLSGKERYQNVFENNKKMLLLFIENSPRLNLM